MKIIQAEQEEIVRNRPPQQKGLTLKEVRKMNYLDKVLIFSLDVTYIYIQIYIKMYN